jgi:hypothetical protein
MVAAGCGYRTGFEVPDDVRTVGVRLFQNDSKQRDLERELHLWMSDSVQRLVGATLVDPRRADLVLEGRLLDYSRRSGIRSPDNLLLETGVKIALEARLVRPAALALAPEQAAPTGSRAADGALGVPAVPSGSVLWRRTLSQEFGFRLDEAGGEGRTRERALRSLADRIVLEAFAQLADLPPSWPPEDQPPQGAAAEPPG